MFGQTVGLQMRTETDAVTPDRDNLAADCEILVLPADGGWSVQAEFADAPLMFRSGARAEKEARVLAGRVAAAGRDVQVMVHDRGGALVGTFRYFAVDPGGLEMDRAPHGPA